MAPAAVLGAALLAACSTTIDPDITVPGSDGSTTTTTYVAGGTTAELLDQLLSEAQALSEAIVDNEGQHDIIARIDVIWEAARPGVEAAAPDGIDDFDRAIALLHNGVDRRRPADADKAHLNLRNLIAALDSQTDTK